MKLKYTLLVLLLSIGITAIQSTYATTQQSISKDGYVYHTVTSGETVYSIAAKYNVLQADIYKLNPDSKRGIKPNQVLKIKTDNPPVADDNSYILHSIQSKETLYSVSKHYNVSIESIMDANPGLNSDNFRMGTAIKIPKKQVVTQTTTNANPNPPKQSNTPSTPGTHKVKAGETLYSISKLYNLSMQEIGEANPKVRKKGLKEGMSLTIPSVKTTPTEERTQTTSSTKTSTNKNSVVKVGLLLPFLNTNKNQQARFVEYYEGFLLAVEDLKSKGYSTEIYAFDIRKGKDTKKLESLLETSEMKGLDLVIDRKSVV